MAEGLCRLAKRHLMLEDECQRSIDQVDNARFTDRSSALTSGRDARAPRV
jgi:hypothetical protein